MIDPLDLLKRKDKWFLGGGKGAIYAPPFPKHLQALGFWDECYLADIRLPHLFTALVLDLAGKPFRFLTEVDQWRPDRLTLIHKSRPYPSSSDVQITIVERRCCTEGNAWVSELSLESSEPVNLLQWCMLDLRKPGYGTPWQSVRDVNVESGSIRLRFDTAWPEELEPDRSATEAEQIREAASRMLEPLPIWLELGASVERLSYSVNLAQKHDESPLWELSMLPEKFRGGSLPGDEKVWVGPEPIEGLLHVYQHYRVEPGQRVQIVCGSGLSAETAHESFGEAVEPGAMERSERDWRRYFASVPQFESSDPYLTNAYWYRWYGLRLNTVDIDRLPINAATRQSGNTFSPFVTEGIGFFRNFITYSAQAHLREVAWMHDPRLAVGILENLGKCQREDGSFPGHNYSCRPARDFYHADFTTGYEVTAANHPEAELAESGAVLARYADYFLTKRQLRRTHDDPGTDGLVFSVFDQNETGQEYMSRYQFASAQADQWGEFEVGGVDATTYVVMLVDLIRGDKDDVASHDYFEAFLGLRSLFEAEAACFRDVKPDGSRSTATPLTSFYPLLIRDLGALGESLGPGVLATTLLRWLLNGSEFWLPKGFPATAKSDPTFSAEGEWKDKRLNCPWNGRSWPMANSHIVDAIANVARMSTTQASISNVNRAGEPLTPNPLSRDEPHGRGGLRGKAGEALMKAITLMFHEGDPSRPNSYEHYNPITGTPALYRGYDDYMHSWIVDLIMRHAVGVQPGEDTVDPLPLEVDWIECRDIPHPRGRMHVSLRRGQEARVEIVRG